MVKMALLLLLFLHLIQAVHPQYLSQPWVESKYAAYFKGTESVTLHCAASVVIHQCYFYPAGDESNVKLSPTCQLSLTASELINWTKHRSPGPINIICYYINTESQPSPPSAPSPVLIEHLSKPLVAITYAADFNGTESVNLHCAASVFLHQCCFYPEGDESNVKHSPTCQLSLTTSELINWTKHRSPGPIKIICYYIKSDTKPSTHSVPAPVFIEYLKPTLSVASENSNLNVVCEITVPYSVREDFRCSLYTGEDQHPFQNAQSQRSTSGKVTCTFTVEKNFLIQRLQSARSHELSCDYKLNTRPTKNSPMSEKYNMINFLPVLTQPHLTTESSTTASTVSSTHHINERGKTMISTTHLITKRGPTTTCTLLPATTKPSPATQKSTAVSTTQLITTRGPTTALLPATTKLSPSTEKSTAVSTTQLITTRELTTDLPHSIQLTTLQTTAVSLTTKTAPLKGIQLIMLSVTGVGAFLAVLMSCCICRFIWKQRTERHTLNLTHRNQGPERMKNEKLKKTEDDVYHVYCTIPDVPTNQQDNTYSLVQMH